MNITAPADANLAPPGYYMLFIVNDQGVPSVASFVRLATGLAAPPSVPALSISARVLLALLLVLGGTTRMIRARARS